MSYLDIKISEEDSDYMYNIVQYIIDECGPRMSCSPQEAKGAEIIKNELEKTCDEVTIEPFTCHPRAALGWIKIDIFMVLISFSLFLLIQLFLNTFWVYILSMLATLLSFLAIIIAWKEFFSYKEFIDPHSARREDSNRGPTWPQETPRALPGASPSRCLFRSDCIGYLLYRTQ